MNTCDSCNAGGDPAYSGESVFSCLDCGIELCGHCRDAAEIDSENETCSKCTTNQRKT